MMVYLAADHRGLKLKNVLRDWLKAEGYEVVDLGATEFNESDDYPDFAFLLAKKVAEGKGNCLGIAVCGSGIGMSIAASKLKGVRAAVVHEAQLAVAARRDDNVNVISMGADFVDEEQAKEILKAALGTNFSGEERHKRRIKKIGQYENG